MHCSFFRVATGFFAALFCLMLGCAEPVKTVSTNEPNGESTSERSDAEDRVRVPPVENTQGPQRPLPDRDADRDRRGGTDADPEASERDISDQPVVRNRDAEFLRREAAREDMAGKSDADRRDSADRDRLENAGEGGDRKTAERRDRELPDADSGEVTTGTNVGNRIPEIEGEDVEGELFALSDYEGNVIMLDFWGDW